MRTTVGGGLMLATAAVLLAALPAQAKIGPPASDVCIKAGYRQGTPAFVRCVARLLGEDPLSGLEAVDLDVRNGIGKGPAALRFDRGVIPMPAGGWNSTSPRWWNFTPE